MARGAATPKTARRRSAAFNEVINTAVEKGYFAENPLNGLRWNAPAFHEEVDPAAVPNPTKVARLLATVASNVGGHRAMDVQAQSVLGHRPWPAAAPSVPAARSRAPLGTPRAGTVLCARTEAAEVLLKAAVS
ncbi:hypothetical protein [Streptomyces sp. NPDC048496]|uniref:hypothetical protein n=1 Tax=Streptomyces sp. NPDC048496 TaxID=3365558 RepID=UPI0037208136